MQHVVLVGESDEQVGGCEIIRGGIGPYPGMDDLKLHLVLGFELTELMCERERILGFIEVSGIGRGVNDHMSRITRFSKGCGVAWR